MNADGSRNGNRRGRFAESGTVCTRLVAGALLGMGISACSNQGNHPIHTPEPAALITLSSIDSTIAVDVRYASENNFLGRVVRGYEGQEEILITEDAAEALAVVQRSLAGEGLGLLVFDAYRPQIAVDDFVEWSENPADTVTRAAYYPGLEKPSLFELGYIAKTSGHTRGNTVDLTLIDLKSGKALDMGSPFDFFGEASHHGYSGITAEQTSNRQKLRAEMEQTGFSAYEKEWWHYRFTGSSQ